MAIIVANSEAWPGIRTASSLMEKRAPGLDIIEASIREIEAEPRVHSVGRGGWPNMAGEVELDASIMNGDTLATGAVAALKGYLYPISIARMVMERLPHVFLVGEGAARFARECGAETAELLTEDSKRGYREWIEENVASDDRKKWPDVDLASYARKAMDPEQIGGTTCVLVQDQSGTISVGVSTSGWSWKYPGRVGDSPIIGAGCYADTRYGGAACIGTGEMAIRTSTSRSVVLYMKMGMSVSEACREAAEDYCALSGGVIRRVVIHAIDNVGNHTVLSAASGKETERSYYLWSPEIGTFEEYTSETFVIR